MKNYWIKTSLLSLLLSLFTLFLFSCKSMVVPERSQPGNLTAKNVILLIGDGMGPEEEKAASMYETGSTGALSFESFPYHATMRTSNIFGEVTDSAASATAMATGTKVKNGVVSVQIPGDKRPLRTVLEYFKNAGKSSGLVTTTYISHATPACFGAHETSRIKYTRIVADYLSDARPNVLFGGAKYMTRKGAEKAGYTVVSTRAEMLGLDTEQAQFVSGEFGSGNMPYEFDGLGNLPHLSEMTTTALSILDNNPDGFFLMVEGGRIDHAGHINDIKRSIFETLEFNRAVQSVIDWSGKRSDTLILVTADHETGGLYITGNTGKGSMPTVRWSRTGHTGTLVNVYAYGKNGDLVSGVMDNQDIFSILTH